MSGAQQNVSLQKVVQTALDKSFENTMFSSALEVVARSAER